MSEYIGSVAIPEVSASGTFPVTLWWGSVRKLDPKVIVHKFGHLEAQAEQRFYQGPGATRFSIVTNELKQSEKDSLVAFFDSRKGSWQPFTLDVVEPDGSTSTYTVRFADPRMSLDQVRDGVWSGSIDLIEEPTTTPTYSVSATATRFPGNTLATALLQQVQEVIPLVKVAPGTGSAFYVSDRRVSIGGQLYQPRILDWDGVSQSIDGAGDDFSVTLGNADRVFTALVNSADLLNAEVEFSLFHVGTTIKVDLWKGALTAWDGSASDEFKITADEGLPLRQASPERIILRQDGFVVPDQPVNVGGKKGIASFTATSVSNDTVYGKRLKEIFVNNADKPMAVDCDIICGRDESEFYSALGIVGAGPISGYYGGTNTNYKHNLDGQTWHGPGNLGLRRSYGGNPATGSETATDNSPDQGSNYFALDSTSTTWPQNGNPIDGVAFLQIRRTDEKGVQPIRPQEKKMQAWITGGLGCWTWSGGVRSWTPSCTNPVWVAIRRWLKRKGLHAASQAAQEATFDVSSAQDCAAICDTVVTKIINSSTDPEGTATEKQFQFTGIISEKKSTRDWLSEILGSCLGYYTTEFGKLKIGMRINASAVEAFTAGNMILGSLQMAMAPVGYNHLIVSYADEDYAFQQNAVQLKDADFGARAGEPTEGNINLVGVSTKSQAARLCSVKLREILGGTSLSEWMAARRVSLKTTILSLATEPGMVCSVTHEDAPGGVVKFRVSKWKLNKDYSIDLSGDSVTNSMYDLTTGPKPSDVPPDQIPTKNWYDVGAGTALKYTSLIGNGSFEQGLVGWTVDPVISAHAELDDTNFWHGTRSLKITSGATGSAAIHQDNIAIAGNTAYVFGGFYFRDGLVVDGSVVLAARWIDGNGDPVGTDIEIPIVDGTDTNKVQFAVNATSPAEAVTVIIYAYQGRHTAGTLNVDGLEFKLFSALAAAAPVDAVTAGLFYSADGTTWGMNSAWTWPGDKTTIKAIERRAFFYSDEAGEVEIGYADLATVSSDTDTATAKDGGDWPGYETETYVSSAVRTLNGDLEKGAWVKSTPVLVDAAYESHSGAYDLTMLASPTVTTVGDQFRIQGQFLPGYISAGVSRTVGAAFWWEPGVDGAPEKVGESPYDTTKAGQPSPDNQGSYDVWISKSSIMSITADGSGNRTGYLHGLAIEPGAFIPFKKHPNQATTAELALTFTPTQLAAAVPLPDPIAPTNLALTIDNASYPKFFIAKPTWNVGAGDLSGTEQYHLQWIFTNASSPAPNSGSAWIRDSYVYGGTNTSYTSDPWPKDMDAPLYVWYRIRSEQGSKNSPWAYLSAGVVANADSETKRPTQPASGDFTLTILGYSKDSADAASQVKLRFTVSNPQTADHTELRMWSGGIPSPVDLARFEAIVKGSGSYDFWWPRVDSGETVYYTAVNCPSPNYRVSPAADNTWKTLAIPAVGLPAAVTGFSVTASAAYLINGQKHIDITYQFTPPAGTDAMEFHMDREGRTDGTFSTLAGLPFGSYQYQVLNLPYVQRAVKCSEFNEYWRYKMVSVDWLGRENPASAVYYNATFIKGDGVNSGALTNTGKGAGVVDGKLVGTIVGLENADFSRGILGWSSLGNVSVSTSQYDSPPASAELKGGNASIWQDVPAVAGQTGILQFKLKNLASSSLANATVYLQAINNAGTTVASAYKQLAYSASWQSGVNTLSIPTGAVSARVYAILESAAGPLETAYLDSVQLDFVTPGTGVSVNPGTGGIDNTAVGAMKNGNFAYGLSDWYTSDSSWALLPLDGNFILNPNGNPGNCCQINAPANGTARQLVQDVPAIPGQTYRSSGTFWNGTNGLCYIDIGFINGAGQPISTSQTPTQIAVGASWVGYSCVKVAPAGTSKARWKVYTAGGTAGSLYVDNASIDPEPGIGGGMTRDASNNIIPKIDNDLLVVDGSGNLTNNFLQTFARAADPALFSLVSGKYTIVTGAVFTNLVAAAVALITGTLQVGGGSTNIVVSPGSITFNTSGGAVVSIGGGSLSMGNTNINGNSITIGGDISISPFAANFAGPVTGQSFSANGSAGLTTTSVINGVTYVWTGGILTSKS